MCRPGSAEGSAGEGSPEHLRQKGGLEAAGAAGCAPLRGFARIPAGQLIQELDHQVAARGARIVLWDADGIRAPAAAD